MLGPEGHLPGTPCLLPGPDLSLPGRLPFDHPTWRGERKREEDKETRGGDGE